MTSYKQLLEQRESLELQIREAKKRETGTAIAQVRALISEFGLTAQDVFPSTKARVARAGAKVAAKYRNTATGQTWTGRGKAPKWIEGKERTQFLIRWSAADVTDGRADLVAPDQLVAAKAFGFKQRIIGVFDQDLGADGTWKLGQARWKRGVEPGLPEGIPYFREVAPDPVQHLQPLFGVRAGQDHDELLAAVAPNQVGLA